MDFSKKIFLRQLSQYGPLIILSGHRLHFPNYDVVLSLKYVLTRNVVPDELWRSVSGRICGELFVDKSMGMDIFIRIDRATLLKIR